MGLLTDHTSTKSLTQLWKVKKLKKQLDSPETPPETVAQLHLRHTYMAAVDFAGPSYFGGKDDQLILCAGKGRPPLPPADGLNIR